MTESFDFTFSLSTSELAEQIAESGFDHEQMFELITLLDAQIADWDFTIRLRDYLTADIPEDVQADHDYVKQQEREAQEREKERAHSEAEIKLANKMLQDDQPWTIAYDEEGNPFLRRLGRQPQIPVAFFDFINNDSK